MSLRLLKTKHKTGQKVKTFELKNFEGENKAGSKRKVEI